MAKGAAWSMKEFQQALRMKRRGISCADIATALGRKSAAVEAKLKCRGKGPVSVPVTLMTEGPISAPEGPTNQNVASHGELTGALCGDPPIGHSALDRRRDAPFNQDHGTIR